MGGRAPGYRLSPDHLQSIKRMLVPDWAQKMLCIIVPNRRTASPEFFSWVRTRLLLSRHSCPVRSPSFPNVSDAISRSNSICTEKILFLTDHNVSQIIGSLRWSGDEKVKKVIAWQGKTTTLHVHHAFLYISLPSLHDYHVKMPIFKFCEGRKQAMTTFSFSLGNWIWLIEIQLQKSSLVFDK